MVVCVEFNFIMLICNGSNEQFYGVKDEHVPVIVIQTNDGQKYLKAHVEPDHIAPWVKDYKVALTLSFLCFFLFSLLAAFTGNLI